ncbi:hypothetical protein KZI27_02360 [Curtobacterium sp. TC1]|uniref:hypothetical protein n=1 Tax=Curtobacterium sp. TC1 TaxID=2862880 RepID=UPI001C9B0796|nr:hypothetical protein [Curtobacterium sp. TC1]QZQ55732.1 hypothetical protein KZI27_02360 [Curtobacterium sp. TC1]
MTRTAGILLALHGAGTSTTRPLRVRAHRMVERGFAPGLPHAVLVPLLEIAAGTALARSQRRSTTAVAAAAAAAAAATALGAVRTGIDLEDRTVTVGTVAAAALAVSGATAVARAHRVGLLVGTGALVVFELTRRRRIRSVGRRTAPPSPVKGTCP